MQDCKLRAVDTAKRRGMIKKGQRVDDSMFSCQVPPYTFLKKNMRILIVIILCSELIMN